MHSSLAIEIDEIRVTVAAIKARYRRAPIGLAIQ
jgi:hypothetical protein